jgi:putative membrane protein (TIGR04086 family)
MIENLRINFRALTLGVLAYIGWSFVLSCILIAITGYVFGFHLPYGEWMTNLQKPIVAIPSVIIGIVTTVLGGFVAGRESKSHEVMHGGIAGCIILFLTLFLPILGWWIAPLLWCRVVFFVGAVPFGMLGGFIAEVTHNKKKNV